MNICWLTVNYINEYKRWINMLMSEWMKDQDFTFQLFLNIAFFTAFKILNTNKRLCCVLYSVFCFVFCSAFYRWICFMLCSVMCFMLFLFCVLCSVLWYVLCLCYGVSCYVFRYVFYVLCSMFCSMLCVLLCYVSCSVTCSVFCSVLTLNPNLYHKKNWIFLLFILFTSFYYLALSVFLFQPFFSRSVFQ